MDSHVAPLVEQALVSVSKDRLVLDLDRLECQSRPIQRRIVRSALRQWQGPLKGLSYNHLEAIADLIEANGGSRRRHLPKGLIAEQTAKILRFRHTTAPGPDPSSRRSPPYQYEVADPQQFPLTFSIKEAGCRLVFSVEPLKGLNPKTINQSRTVLLDMDMLVFPLVVRNGKPGDRFRPFGMQGSQKIHDLLINRKIPLEKRHSLPLLLNRESIVWVVGVRRGASATVTPATSRILRVEVYWNDHPEIPDNGPPELA
jgi:tRNA(Ile)-lysidine synthase